MPEGVVAGWRVIKRRKKWDNCNSIINKIYLKWKKRTHACPEKKKSVGGK